MESAADSQRILSRGLLTPAEREFLRGENEVQNPDSYLYNVRSNFRGRVEELEEDLEILREAGEDKLVEEFEQTFAPTTQLEQRVDELEQRLNDEPSD